MENESPTVTNVPPIPSTPVKYYKEKVSFFTWLALLGNIGFPLFAIPFTFFAETWLPLLFMIMMAIVAIWSGILVVKRKSEVSIRIAKIIFYLNIVIGVLLMVILTN